VLRAPSVFLAFCLRRFFWLLERPSVEGLTAVMACINWFDANNVE